MSSNLNTIHEYAHNLRHLNMLQAAGDFDYLVAWIRSPEWSGGIHLKPNPAGKGTVDAYSNNCPIPFPPCCKLAEICTDKRVAIQYIKCIKPLIQDLLNEHTNEVEQIAIQAYLDYCDDLIKVLSGEEPGPVPPIHPAAYINSVINERAVVYSDEDQTKTIPYNVANNYTVINWYDENGTAHPFANDITLDRCPESNLPGTVCVFNQTGNPVFVQYIEYELSVSNKLQGCFAGSDGEIAQSVTVQPGEYAAVCAMDTSDPDNLLAVPVLYENFTAYTGSRYRNQSNTFVDMGSSGLEFRKEYNSAVGEYVLVIYNNTASAITIKDFEYSKSEAHVLNIVAPSNVVGVSCTINAIYDATAVTPEWAVSPSGPTISGDTLTFTESGEYTLQASYNGLVATKNINVEYKVGWSTETVIDESGDYPIANTTTTDPDGNKESEIVTYIDGEPVNTGFELEPGSEDGTIAIDEGKDTKIYTFDGTNGFELFFKFHYDPSLQPPPDYANKPGETDTAKHYTLLNMKYEVAPYPGIVFRHNENSPKLQISITPMNPTDPTHPTVSVEIDLTHTGIPDIYMHDLYMRYEPSAPFEKFVIVDNTLGTGDVKTRIEYYTYEFSNEITATLGYVNAGTVEDPIPCRQCLFDVYDFRLNKIMNPWKEFPIITETSHVGNLLITKEITNDDNHIVKRLLIEPDPELTNEEYAYLDDGLIFNDIKPFIDKDQVFELEYDVMVDYADQTFASNDNFVVLINAISEPVNWPGLCIRLSKQCQPDELFPNGRCDTRLRYTTNKDVPGYTLVHSSERVNGISYDGYKIDDDHIIHYRYIYEGTASTLCSAIYSYKTNSYVICTNRSLLYAVTPHNFPLCIGCAVDSNLQKIRNCRMRIKKIEYIRNIK